MPGWSRRFGANHSPLGAQSRGDRGRSRHASRFVRCSRLSTRSWTRRPHGVIRKDCTDSRSHAGRSNWTFGQRVADSFSAQPSIGQPTDLMLALRVRPCSLRRSCQCKFPAPRNVSSSSDRTSLRSAFCVRECLTSLKSNKRGRGLAPTNDSIFYRLSAKCA